MSAYRWPCLWALSALFPLASGAAATPPCVAGAGEEGALPAPLQTEETPSVRVALEGFVLAPDGVPAEGAVVVTSAGGQAVVAPDGSYRLEVEIPLAAERVQVTAVGSGPSGLVGSRSVEVLSGAGRVGAGTLFLEQGGSCPPGWIPTFGSEPGTSGPVLALAVFDDGDGPRLHAACGRFAGGVQVDFIAKWDGASWAPLGSGIFGGGVYALTVFDDGSGDKLYAGGSFSMAGGVAANRIAAWDGTTWAPLGSGMDDDFFDNPAVYALTTFDDGSGEKLYAGGLFNIAGGALANRIARWDGASWSPLGSGLGGFSIASVQDLTVFDDGGGEALYAGGGFTTAGGVAASMLARWDGTQWTPLGAGMDGTVYALTVFEEGSGGKALCAGGAFTMAGGMPASRIARWDGATWTSLASGMDSAVFALTAFDDGGGSELYAAGDFTSAGGVPTNSIAKWDGTSWAPLGSGLVGGSAPNRRVSALTAFDDGGGNAIYAGGDFDAAGGLASNRIAKWDGAGWATLGSGMDDAVQTLAAFDDGGGQALYAAGSFTTAGGLATSHIAKWDGTSWAPLGAGLEYSGPGTGLFLGALEVFDDGGGDALYVGGRFTSAGGAATNNIAEWNGTTWAALGSGIENTGFSVSVSALTVFDDGGGDALYVGGFFDTAGGVTAYSIAKWDGTNWAPLGSGTTGLVSALTVFDDGSGEKLYAGGSFIMAGGVVANGIAMWDGTTWNPLGSGLEGGQRWLKALTVFDDGGGNALYAGGSFTTAGGVAASNVARWDGTSWTPLGSGVDLPVNALAVFDDGSGEKLYAGGNFTTAGGVAANRIAQWDGTSWTPLGAGMAIGGSGSPVVLALTPFDDGSGSALYAGGQFTASDSGDSFLAKWGVEEDTTPPVLNCPEDFTVFHGGRAPAGGGPATVVSFFVSAGDDCDPAPAVVCAPPSGSVFDWGTTTVTATATDSSGNVSTCAFDVTVRPPASEADGPPVPVLLPASTRMPLPRRSAEPVERGG